MTQPPIPPASAPAPQRPSTGSGQGFVKRGFYLCCVTCGMAQEWCGCAKAPTTTTNPGRHAIDARSAGTGRAGRAVIRWTAVAVAGALWCGLWYAVGAVIYWTWRERYA